MEADNFGIAKRRIMQKKRIVIVGAGVGGLAAACILSRYCNVRLIERADRPGGKIRQTEIDGAKIDSGPTVFTMRWVFDELFNRAGARFDEHVSFSMLETLARHAWRDGSQLDLYGSVENSADAIAGFAGQGEAVRYRKFCARAKQIYDALRDPFLRSDKPDMTGLIRRTNPLALHNIQPFSTLWQVLSKQFRDPRLRQLFARYATYCGSSPFEAPATLMLIAHVEQSGVWTLDGGMSALAAAMESLARKNGADITYSAHVSEIASVHGEASGVVLQSGEYVKADAVILNADVAALVTGCFGPASASAVAPPPAGAQRSQSAITRAMLAKTSGFDLSVHNVFFSDDYEREFDAVFHQQSMPPTPTTYIFAPDRQDAQQTPGAVSADRSPERLFCLINAPSAGDKRAFGEKEIDLCEQQMDAHLRRCGLTIASEPDQKIVTTPADFAERFPATGGALYGMASHGWQASFQRPGIRTKMKGLYLAGGSAHPGPGVPMAALSGQAAAAAVLKDYDLT